jgi:hypothetical protein
MTITEADWRGDHEILGEFGISEIYHERHEI